MQSVRPQLSQRATETRCGCCAQRSSGDRGCSSGGTGRKLTPRTPAASVDTRPRGSIGSGPMEPRVAVLASGGGTNLQALLDDPVVAASVVVVASDRPDSGALERARAGGVATEFVDPSESFDREG